MNNYLHIYEAPQPCFYDALRQTLSPAHTASESLQSFLFLRLFSSLTLVITEENIRELKGIFHLCKET